MKTGLDTVEDLLIGNLAMRGYPRLTGSKASSQGDGDHQAPTTFLQRYLFGNLHPLTLLCHLTPWPLAPNQGADDAGSR